MCIEQIVRGAMWTPGALMSNPNTDYAQFRTSERSPQNDQARQQARRADHGWAYGRRHGTGVAVGVPPSASRKVIDVRSCGGDDSPKPPTLGHKPYDDMPAGPPGRAWL